MSDPFDEVVRVQRVMAEEVERIKATSETLRHLAQDAVRASDAAAEALRRDFNRFAEVRRVQQQYLDRAGEAMRREVDSAIASLTRNINYRW